MHTLYVVLMVDIFSGAFTHKSIIAICTKAWTKENRYHTLTTPAVKIEPQPTTRTFGAGSNQILTPRHFRNKTFYTKMVPLLKWVQSISTQYNSSIQGDRCTPKSSTQNSLIRYVEYILLEYDTTRILINRAIVQASKPHTHCTTVE